jgi:GNAT superfamily N-acetyltransferase
MQYGVEYVARVRDFLKLPWLKKAGASRGFSIRRWDSLDRSAKERLEHEMGPQSWRREGIGPNSWRHPVHEISLALVAPDEKIAGWLLTHLQGEDTLCYDSFYVRPQYRHLGVSLFMLVSAVRLQQEAGIELGCWLVNSHRRNTKRLYDTKLRQAIEARAEVWISSRYGGEVALD